VSIDRVGHWVETIATVGVILSLLFVGFEIRQNTAIARGQARQDLTQVNQEWLVLLSQDAEYEALWTKAFGKTVNELTPGEWRRSRLIMTIQMRRLENVFLQYQEGLVDESALRNYGFVRTEIFTTPQFEEYWITEEWRDGFDAEFVNFFDSLRHPVREGGTND